MGTPQIAKATSHKMLPILGASQNLAVVYFMKITQVDGFNIPEGGRFGNQGMVVGYNATESGIVVSHGLELLRRLFRLPQAGKPISEPWCDKFLRVALTAGVVMGLHLPLRACPLEPRTTND